jgi:small ligand-binding sensory domain FIST
MSPIVDWYHHVHGTSPNTIPFIQGYKALSVGLNFDFHNVWKVGVNYSTFSGGGNLNLMRDRDVLGATVSYTF